MAIRPRSLLSKVSDYFLLLVSHLVQTLFILPASIWIQILLYITQTVVYPNASSPTIKRTRTRHLTSFTRPGPAAVTYDLSQRSVVTITVPPQSTWSTSPHWHETHTEYLQVIHGLARITLSGQTRIYSASDGIVTIPPFTIHEWRREATGYARPDGQEGVDLVVREWTSPADGQKGLFFRTLNSYLLEPQPQRLHRPFPLPTPSFLVEWVEGRVDLLQVLVIFRAMDNWPVLFNRYVERVNWRTWGMTHAYLLFAVGIGKALGLDGTYEEYTGDELGKIS